MTKHDFEAALMDLNTMRQWLELAHEEPIEKILNNRPIKQSLETIQFALRLAQTLKDGAVSEDVISAMASEYDPTWGYPDASVGRDWAKESLKAMIEQLFKEVENER
jgi:hypothetical protein